MKFLTLLQWSILLLRYGLCCYPIGHSQSIFTQKITLKTGVSYSLTLNRITHRFRYDSTQINFSEGLVEAGVTHVYQRGSVRLTVDEQPFLLKAEGHYDDKGGRRARDWAYLEETKAIVPTGRLRIGVANFYPATRVSSNRTYLLELLIQSQ